MKKLLAILVGAAITIGGASALSVANATPGGGGETPVTLCHATAAATNPYVVITVDAASAGGQAQLEGHAGHTGPIFDPETNVSGDNWGDIIPAYSYVVANGPDAGTTVDYPGMNLTEEGLAILANGCKLPGSTPTPVPPVINPAASLTAKCVGETDVTATATLDNTASTDGTEEGGTAQFIITVNGSQVGDVYNVAAGETATVDVTGLATGDKIEVLDGRDSSALASFSVDFSCKGAGPGPEPTPKPKPKPTPETPTATPPVLASTL